MALEDLRIEVSDRRVPPEIQRIIDASDKRIDSLFASGENKRVPKYIPSDPVAFYGALDFLTRSDLPLGRVFCEWGSGMGVASCIAAELGYDSYGLEIDPSMAKAARDMIEDLALDVTILETSYVPVGFESYSGIGGEYLITDGSPTSLIYEGMDQEIADIDVFFVYPWPMEQEFMQELFDRIAVEGAILISYHKDGEVLALRKSGEDELY